jgi:hypothetical protein
MKQNHNPLPVILLVVFAALVCGCTAFTTQPPATTDAANSQELPFSDARQLVVPAETVVYVRLKEPISAAGAEAGQSFPAVLDQPLLADNQVIAAEGTEVVGQVVAARESGRLHTAGYVRIRLSSIQINGKQFPLVTNSLLAAGGSVKKRSLSIFAGGNSFFDTGSKEAGFSPMQRLAFRLTQPLSVSAN